MQDQPKQTGTTLMSREQWRVIDYQLQLKARALKTYAEMLYWRSREKEEEAEAVLRRVEEAENGNVEKIVDVKMNTEATQKAGEKAGWGDMKEGGLPIREKPKAEDEKLDKW